MNIFARALVDDGTGDKNYKEVSLNAVAQSTTERELTKRNNTLVKNGLNNSLVVKFGYKDTKVCNFCVFCRLVVFKVLTPPTSLLEQTQGMYIDLKEKLVRCYFPKDFSITVLGRLPVQNMGGSGSLSTKEDEDVHKAMYEDSDDEDGNASAGDKRGQNGSGSNKRAKLSCDEVDIMDDETDED